MQKKYGNIFKKFLALSLALGLAFSCFACACTHRDADDNGVCDSCGVEFTDGEELSGGSSDSTSSSGGSSSGSSSSGDGSSNSSSSDISAGGNGSMHLRREKFVPKGGPDGGDGGKGGSIILQGDRQYWTLIHLKYQRHQFAEDGEGGHGARSSGKDAADIIIPVPLGTVARRVVEQEDGSTTIEYVGEVTEHGEQLTLLKGGRGGLGNWHFRTATNQAPRYSQPGEEGAEGAFILELKVLADVGLVGFPNAGKSTLLSVVSAAKPKIANYAFTTLEPNLGIVEVRDGHSFVMADIPGIIEGAHEGKGLGTRFLRHIERNSILLFMVPADSDDIKRDYEILLGELTQYNPELLDKSRILAITKCDMLDDELIEEMKAHLPEGIKSVFISSVASLNIPKLKDMLWEALHE